MNTAPTVSDDNEITFVENPYQRTPKKDKKKNETLHDSIVGAESSAN